MGVGIFTTQKKWNQMLVTGGSSLEKHPVVSWASAGQNTRPNRPFGSLGEQIFRKLSRAAGGASIQNCRQSAQQLCIARFEANLPWKARWRVAGGERHIFMYLYVGVSAYKMCYRQIDRQIDRQTDRQIDRQTYIYTYVCVYIYIYNIYIYTHFFFYLFICIYIYTFIFLNLFMYIYIYIYLYIFICMSNGGAIES